MQLISYFVILVCLAILFVSLLLLVVVFRKHYAVRALITICVLVVVVEGLVFSFYPIPHYRFDTVQLTALGTHNENSKSSEVFFVSVNLNGATIKFPEVESGKWFWRNGMYCWRPETDTRQPEGCTRSVTLKIPVGMNRVCVFSSHAYAGNVEISYNGESKVIDLYSETAKNTSLQIPASSKKDIMIDAALRIVSYIVLHTVIFLLVAVITQLLSQPLLSLVKRYKYELVFFASSIMTIIKNGIFPGNNAYTSAFYFNSYEFGFIKRGFIGELFTNLSPYISAESFALYKLCFLVLFYLMVAILLGRIIREQNDERIRWFFIVLACALPSTYIFIQDDVRPDIYLVMLFVICTALLMKDRLIWLIPILMTFMLLINETCCTYMIPTLLAMMFYKGVRRKKAKYYAGTIAGALFTCIITFAVLLGDDPRIAKGISNYVLHAQEHAAFNILNGGALNAETIGLPATLEGMQNQIAGNYTQVIIYFLLLIPIFLLLGCLWHSLLKRREEKVGMNRFQGFALGLLIVSGLSAFATMIISFDYPRYTSMMLWALIAAIFFYCHEERIQINYDTDLCIGRPAKSSFNIFPVLVCVFYFVYGIFASTAYSTPIVKRFYVLFHNLF